MRVWIVFFLSLCLFGPKLPLHAEVQTGPHITLELLSEQPKAAAGEPFRLGLKLEPDQGWHTYWHYPGDTGAAPIFQWAVNGERVEPIVQWPTPEKFQFAHLANYGYGEETLLMFQFPAINSPGRKEVTLDLELLVCEEECIPTNHFFTLPLEVAEQGEPFQKDPLFTETEALLPTEGTRYELSALQQSPAGMVLQLSGGEPLPNSLLFIPDSAGQIDNGADQVFERSGTTASLRLSAENGTASELSGLLLIDGEEAGRVISVPVSQGEGPSPSPAASSPTFLFSLIGAFIGGLILNLMPCVFPIISLKILGFVKKAGKSRLAAARQGGLFAFGVLFSFWILAAIVYFLRASGQELGWGFQLQTPWFVAFLALLMFAVGLNLAGLFEFGYGLQTLAGRTERKAESRFGAFASGMLATLLATPCTAPFMGSAVGYALTLPLLPNLAIFTSLGLGMASPYVVLSASPKLLQKLPRPGDWMSTFQQVVSFPVFATVVWLVWVYEQQSGGSLVPLLCSFLLLSFGLWIFGLFVRPECSRGKRWLGFAIALLFSAAAVRFAMPAEAVQSEVSGQAEIASTSGERDQYGLAWYPYREDLLQEIKAKGQPIFFDFTAAWCITCQVNKKVVFSSEAVRKAVVEKQILLVRGDWTNEDPAITRALESYGRLGVPLNVLWKPSDPENPVVFPSVLTAQMVLDEFESLSLK